MSLAKALEALSNESQVEIINETKELLKNESVREANSINTSQEAWNKLKELSDSDRYSSLKDEDEKKSTEEKKILDLLKRLSASLRYKFIVKEEETCGLYSFSLVDECCILAKSSVSFKSTTSRDIALERAKSCVRTEEMHLIEHILLRPSKSEQTVTINEDCMLGGCPDCHCVLDWVNSSIVTDCKSKEQD